MGLYEGRGMIVIQIDGGTASTLDYTGVSFDLFRKKPIRIFESFYFDLI